MDGRSFFRKTLLAYGRNKGIEARIARYHNIFGPLGSWNDGREKAPAALCRKVAEADSDGIIEVWGDGLQTRSFLYIDDCVEAYKNIDQIRLGGPSEHRIRGNDIHQ